MVTEKDYSEWSINCMPKYSNYVKSYCTLNTSYIYQTFLFRQTWPTKKLWRSAIILHLPCDLCSQSELRKQWRSFASQHVFLWLREDRRRITASTTIAVCIAGYSVIPLQLFFISRLFMVRFSNVIQQNDGNTLLSTVLVSDKAQIYFLFSSW